MRGGHAILERIDAAASEARRDCPTALRVRLGTDSFVPEWLAPLRRAPEDDLFYWRQPEARRTVLALGCFRAVETRGAERFRDGADRARELLREIRSFGDSGPAAFGPLAVGGFAFADAVGRSEAWDGFPGARLIVPELALVQEGGELWITVCGGDPSSALEAAAARLPELWAPGGADDSSMVAPGNEAWKASGVGPEYRVRSDRSHVRYCAQVRGARRAIGSGDLQKVVLARSLRVDHDGRLDVAGLLSRLAALYPCCVTFAIQRPGARFVGSTPELLVSRRGSRIRTAAVAGSAPRGRSPEEDERLGRTLRESKKEQEEHAIVVRAIAEALTDACAELSVPEAPRLLRIEGIQHLETPIEGTLREQRSVLEMAGRLHPTPAVCGTPTEAAAHWIARHEDMDRGWYAGAIGFLDAEGEGELRVALRSGVVRSGPAGDRAWLFAGGGLVADSDPQQELEETRGKLRALLAPLTEI